MHDYEITNPGNIVNGQLLRRKMAHLTQQLGVVAQTQATGKSDTVDPVLDMLKAFQKHMLNVKGYPALGAATTFWTAKPAAPAEGEHLWTIPSVLYNQAGACVRELLIRAGQQAVYDAEVSSPDTAKLLFAMTEDVAKELAKIAKTAPVPAAMAAPKVARSRAAKAPVAPVEPVEVAEEVQDAAMDA